MGSGEQGETRATAVDMLGPLQTPLLVEDFAS